ncbi:O-antigen ligase family protein [Micromonospora sp. WMMD956]|uniref:O-antigen ligase family protein n=1 Tax=Micromonospora TaxID=1873 RepID=UPI002417FC32|nr:O-antigen ligase family protein [Micromonospora sp. WMMD956]MDG4816119.1 O-antigen ligase family protein [Micromonospora sp. WMMD956]
MTMAAPLRPAPGPRPASAGRHPAGPSQHPAQHPPEAPTRRWSLRLPVAWPVTALFVLYPAWWALGLPSFIFAILAIPMAFQLYRRGNVKVPPGFGIWLILLAWVVLSGLMLGITAPNTLPPSGSGRYIGWGIRVMNYTALTVTMLYVLNLSERELPRGRLVKLFGFMAVVTVIGGYVGALFPQLKFVAPLNYILPAAIAKEPFVNRLMHVEVAQVQEVLAGEASSPRPAAPFEYTNTWGENMAILLIWFIVGWVVLGRGPRRLTGYLVVVAAVFPIVYSLNRGLWIGLVVGAVYVAVRLALRGRVVVLVGLALASGLMGVAVLASPLGDLLNERMANGHSDDIRATLSSGAVEAANHSPVLGYGGNRALIGSNRSIAIGKSAECKQCGNRELGSNGQVWNLLTGQGWVGAFCYSAFFLWCLWRFRHDNTPIGIAGSLVLILMLFFQFLYGSLNTTLAYGLISVALLARNDLHLREARRAARLAAVEAASAPAAPGARPERRFR